MVDVLRLEFHSGKRLLHEHDGPGQQLGDNLLKLLARQVDAGDAKRDANYKVAVEKCDAMAGDAKASCLSAAKVSFGKS